MSPGCLHAAAKGSTGPTSSPAPPGTGSAAALHSSNPFLPDTTRSTAPIANPSTNPFIQAAARPSANDDTNPFRSGLLGWLDKYLAEQAGVRPSYLVGCWLARARRSACARRGAWCAPGVLLVCVCVGTGASGRARCATAVGWAGPGQSRVRATVPPEPIIPSRTQPGSGRFSRTSPASSLDPMCSRRRKRPCRQP